jgi:hypothetical protein
MLEALFPNVVDEYEELVFHSFGRYFAVGYRAVCTHLGKSDAHQAVSFPLTALFARFPAHSDLTPQPPFWDHGH